MRHVKKNLLLLKKCWYDCRTEGHLYVSFKQMVKGCYKQPLPPAAPEPGNSSYAAAGAQPGVPCNLEVSIPDWWTQLLLSHLQVQSVARLNMYPRDTHTERTCARLAIQTAIGKALCSTAPTCNACRSDITAKSPSSSLAGKDWLSLVKAHVHLWVPQALVRPLCPPSTPAWILDLLYPLHGSPARQLVQLGACCKWTHTLAHLSHRHPTLVGPPKYQHEPSGHLIALPGPRACYSLVSSTWGLWVNTQAQPMHAQLVS